MDNTKKNNIPFRKLGDHLDVKSPTFSTFLSLVIMVILFSAMNPMFLRAANLMTILMNAAIIGVMASGMTMVILTGGIDLSCASMSAFAAMVLGACYSYGIPVLAGGIIAILVAGFCGLINGLLITKMRVFPMIATLSMGMVYRALAYAITDNKVVTINDALFKAFARSEVLGIPISIIYMLLFYAVVGFVLTKTPFGRKLYAIGGNKQASYLSGINIQRTSASVYVLSAMIAAFAGIMNASQAGACIGQSMLNREFDVIAGVVLGGVSMNGGKGKLLGTFLGVTLLAVVSNGMVMIGLQSYWQNLAKGLIMIASIMLDANRTKKEGMAY